MVLHFHSAYVMIGLAIISLMPFVFLPSPPPSPTPLACRVRGMLVICMHCRMWVGFSYMTDPRHLKDTLFICFESDFRFYKADGLPPETWLPLAVAPSEESAPGAQPESGASRPLEASSASGSRDTPPTLMPAVQLRPDADSLGRWKSITTLPRPYKTGYSVVTDELADLVQLATVASRQGVGDLIWFGHTAGQKNKPRRTRTSPSDPRGHVHGAGSHLLAARNQQSTDRALRPVAEAGVA